VRKVARWQGRPVVTSFYLDVDGRRYPRPSDYAPHVDELFRVARKRAEMLGKAVADAVDADLSKIADWLGRGLDRRRTHGLAVLSTQGAFEAFELPVSVPDQVAVEPFPDVAPLCAILAEDAPTLAVAVDGQQARMLRLDLHGTEELAGPTDALERQADTTVELGSFEHRHEEQQRQHFRRVARSIADALAQRPVRYLVLLGSTEATASLESDLPAHLQSLVAGRVPHSVHDDSTELEQAARRAVDHAQSARRLQLAHELRERSFEGAAAVCGLDATLDALGAQLVDTLLVERGFRAPGGRCLACGLLVRGQNVGAERICRRCGGNVVEVDNVVDAAVTEAFVHHVALAFYEEGSLIDVGRIGALLRH